MPVEAKVEMLSLLSYSDVAPLLDSLNEQFLHLEVSRWDVEPPAASGIGPEAAVILAFVRDHGASIAAGIAAGGATAFWSGFIQKMGEDTWDAVREQLVRLLSRGR